MIDLIGSAMCEYLPLKDYCWLTSAQLEGISADPDKFVNSIADNADKGYFLEIDLEVERYLILNSIIPLSS